ncbi:MAG: 50S ribosomal protein L11 methyltransferase [Deltaproteobacteria bacterium]|nr:50S ribosomal protein L11 methyltransferase [Deltaproteobacteria bacterium]
MRPETILTIYEIRAAAAKDLDFLGGPPEPEERFGSDFRGLHFEADFAFLFFVNDYDLGPFLSQYPFVEVKQIHRLRYDQWQDGATMEPMSVGPIKIWPWFEASQTPNLSLGLNNQPDLSSDCPPIYIDPGLAFGFGGHPTTKACLGFLARLYRPGALGVKSPLTALDLGSGTGILALAAARLGANSVLGVDHSHLAVRSAQRNAELNALNSQVKFERGLAQDYAKAPGELVLANMPLFVLKDLLDLRAFDKRSHLIFSGLLASEGDTFLDLLTQSHKALKLVDSQRDDRWVSGLVEF